MINLNEERILDFLDGRLATPDEEELLHTLAVSPERRQLMRTHMKLREVTNTLSRQDRFSVPERVTSQLFNRLEEAGFTPSPTPDAILARAPQMLSTSAANSLRVAGAAAGAAVATGLSSGWRFGMMGLLAASVMSFVLGAGAYYVFGSSLGLRTHSQEMAALHPALQHHAASGLASQFAVSQNNASPTQPATVALAGNNLAQNNISQSSGSIRQTGPIRQIGPIGQIGPISNSEISSTPVDNSADVAVSDNAAPITYTAPRENPYTMESDQLRLLDGPSPIWPSVVPSPLANDRGTIGVRYGVGQGPQSTNSPMSSLNEFAFKWTMWNYVVARASMGQMRSYERTAQLTPTSKGNIITTDQTAPTSTTMIGLETGVTLDPIGVPIDAMVGFMYSGGGSPDYSLVYERASLMAHFEPWKMLEISAGLEGLIYTHYLGKAINNLKAFNSMHTSTDNPSEVCGLVGPALEIGWHF